MKLSHLLTLCNSCEISSSNPQAIICFGCSGLDTCAIITLPFMFSSDFINDAISVLKLRIKCYINSVDIIIIRYQRDRLFRSRPSYMVNGTGKDEQLKACKSQFTIIINHDNYCFCLKALLCQGQCVLLPIRPKKKVVVLPTAPGPKFVKIGLFLFFFLFFF